MATKKARAPAAFTTIEVSVRNAIGIIGLNRPDVHNAFDEVLIRELTAALEALGADDAVRAVILAGNGPSFCAGADLNWMKKMAAYSHAENVADAEGLARMLQTLHTLEKPTIARVHGAAYGGGVGLIACCDIAIGAVESTFALSEAKLGLIPATISPYVIEAIGARQAGRYFLTAERFEAAEAFRIGLLHDIVPIAQLDDRVNETLGPLLLVGPHAQRECKALIRAVAHRPLDAKVIADTVQRIARVRASPEGKEGVAAFLGKRPAAWVPADLRRTK
jgi:methylglutaconyl-CoA hydratase